MNTALPIGCRRVDPSDIPIVIRHVTLDNILDLPEEAVDELRHNSGHLWHINEPHTQSMFSSAFPFADSLLGGVGVLGAALPARRVLARISGKRGRLRCSNVFQDLDKLCHTRETSTLVQLRHSATNKLRPRHHSPGPARGKNSIKNVRILRCKLGGNGRDVDDVLVMCYDVTPSSWRKNEIISE